MRHDPALYVAATRYAIRRHLTGMGETIAREVHLAAEEIRQDQGCTAAIVREIETIELEQVPDEQRAYPGEWHAHVERWRLVKAKLLEQPPPSSTMGLGWNEPAPATHDEFVELLEDVLAMVKAGDSFEGFIEYTMPVSDPWEEERAERDARWGQAAFAVRARYRVGNSMGQGGLAVFTKPREVEDADES